MISEQDASTGYWLNCQFVVYKVIQRTYNEHRYFVLPVRTEKKQRCTFRLKGGKAVLATSQDEFLMSTRQIHVFISHAWDYSGHYDKLAEWIFEEKWSSGQASLDFRDYSIPKSDPIHNASNTQELTNAILDRIGRSHVVIIPSGMYATHSKWIRREIDGAKELKKPILGVNPWGTERKSSVVLQSANETVGWNKEPLVNKIWELYYKANP